MAFNPERLALVVEPIGGVGLRWFNYQTDESEDDLIAADYLPDADKYGLRAYDLIFVSPASGTEEPYILTVDAIDADGNATLVNSSRFGSDTLSYSDKASVGLIRIPAATDNILVSAYDATVDPSVGRAYYRAASDADYAATPALLRLTDAGGRKFVINEKRLSPDMAGGAIDGTGDASAALNAVFEYIRTEVAANPGTGYYTRYTVDLAGGVYRTTASIDATNISAFNLTITNGVIIGACTGKAVIDLSGSRGWTLKGFVIFGEEDNMPTMPVLGARSITGAQACDMHSYEDVSFLGWYSLTADYCYGQETTHRRHCRFWNYNEDGYAGIIEGYDVVSTTSDFQTLKTGSVSFINNQFDTCDWRYFPAKKLATITGITKGATTTVSFSGNYPVQDGDTVIFWQVGGMTQINNLSGTASSADADSFVVDIDSSAFSNWTSGGFAIKKATKPAVRWSRGQQHRFTNCYIVGYGDDALVIDWPDSFTTAQLSLDVLFEGALERSCIRFTPGTSSRTIRQLDIKTYNTNALTSFFSTDASGGGQVTIVGGQVRVTNHTLNASLPLFDDPTKYSIQGDFGISYPTRAAANVSTLAFFDGDVAANDDGKTLYGKRNQTWTPTVAATGGSGFAATGAGLFRMINAELAYIEVTITVTTTGTGSGSITFTLPSGVTGVAAQYGGLNGSIIGGAGVQLKAFVGGAASVVNIQKYDNTYAGADGALLKVWGTMRLTM